MAEAFVTFTLQKQIEIALIVQSFQNAPYILFDKSFQPARVIMVDKYRVEVDAQDRRAILSTGAQHCFTCEQYCRYAPLPNNAVIQDGIVSLPQKGAKR